MDKITRNFVTVVPAYGRDYTKASDVLVDFKAGKDFLIQDFDLPSTLVNREQFQTGVKVNVRYAKLRKVAVVTA